LVAALAILGAVTVTGARPVLAANPPINRAMDDTFSVLEDSVNNSLDVLANDPAGPRFSILSVGSPANGNVNFTATTVYYTPNVNFFGSDSFTYLITDGVFIYRATVTVTVVNVNDPPDARDDAVSVPQGSNNNSLDVLANDTFAPDPPETLLVTALGTAGTKGSVAIINGGTSVSYTPPSDFFGADSFTYTISDGNGGQDTATVTVTVKPVSRPAVVRKSTTWLLRSSLTTGNADAGSFSLGTTPLVPVIGDWDGNGSKTPGYYKDGAFQLSNDPLGAGPLTTVSFGSDPRGFPVAGDFDGDGKDDLGVFRNGNWQIRLTGPGTVLPTFTYGSGSWPGTVPVAGDWDGDGTDGIGTYVAGTWSLRNTASAGSPSITPFTFNPGTSPYPVVGDWNGDGIDTVGVRSASGADGLWSLTDDNATIGHSFTFGLANDLPVVWLGPSQPIP
jgi:hypothetical protein